jgi:microcystin-dependent protein
MGQPYVGEIRMFGGNFPPNGWAFCDGSLIPISENDTLFNLIGTTYGGDGQSTFALPDLRGRLPMHRSSTIPHGQSGGVETVTLTVQQMPAHSHAFLGSSNQGGSTNPPANVVAQIPGGNAYIQDVASVAFNAQSLLSTGGSQPHENLQPFLCVSFIIALYGVYPTQN